MFRTVLIANRGEIACRVIRTCRRLGLRTVAVYSDADQGAPHVALADEARRIGTAPSRESYLAIAAVIGAARAAGAEAVHPGYGFLAENAAFAEACAAAGLVFVGPPPGVIRAMGEKHAARALMAQAGVPVVPGYHGAAQDLPRLEAAARETGLPLLLKPAAGGGGKGMRVVERMEDLAEAAAGARREAGSAFGDERLILERFLPRARHIEVQVFADTRGNVVHLHERDCSIQRRYQKVIEEAPAPGLGAGLRGRLGEVAVTAARAVGYVGAGTIEMLVDGTDAFFMEMNTRLQVEHPVTEMITGIDLVEWQLLVAAGKPLPLLQDEIRAHGHAIEARLYAEDPARDFAPSTGRLALLRLPEGEGVRVDSGVREGDAVSVHYDPLLAKIVATGRDRDEALARLRRALGEVRIAGVRTNAEFLSAILAHPDVVAGAVDTQFLAREGASLRRDGPVPDEALVAAALAVLLDRDAAAGAAAARSPDLWSPWHDTGGWRLHGAGRETVVLRHGDAAHAVGVQRVAPAMFRLLPPPQILLPQGEGGRSRDPIEVKASRVGPDVRIVFADKEVTATVAHVGGELTVFLDGGTWRLALDDPMEAAEHRAPVAGTLTAPIPGVISAVFVAAGASVRRGEALLVLEAMKMEHQIRSPADGTVEVLHVSTGDQVEEGTELARVQATEGEG